MRVLLWLTVMLLALQSPLQAAESGGMQIRMDQKVVYCAARVDLPDETFSEAMKDGVDVATEWHIQVGRVREYWLDESIADITVIRRARPDLLTRSWLLSDSSSGISRRVYRLQDAIAFLSTLENFPVLDRSLLTAGASYRMSVRLDVHAGGIDDAWWANLLRPAAAEMQQDFSLP